MINGDAYAWGHSGYGGDASSVDLTDIVDISCGGYACVALKNDGTVVAWGSATSGGDAPSLTDTYSQATPAQLRSAMIKNDGTVVAWGDATSGGNAPSLTDTYSQATPAQLRSAMNDQNCRI